MALEVQKTETVHDCFTSFSDDIHQETETTI